MPKKDTTRKTNPWLIAGVIVLIVLLFGWLTMADFADDTDVAASPNFASDAPAASQSGK